MVMVSYYHKSLLSASSFLWHTIPFKMSIQIENVTSKKKKKKKDKFKSLIRS